MDFYMAKYKRQYFDGSEWKDTEYQNQTVVVLANSRYEAIEKVEKCLQKAEKGNYRAELVGNVKKCIGIDFREDPEIGTSIHGIIEK